MAFTFSGYGAPTQQVNYGGQPQQQGGWVNPLDPKNFSFSPQGGQGLFNPTHQQVYWNAGTPSFQAPQQGKAGPQGQPGQMTYGAPAQGWTGQGSTYSPLPTYGGVSDTQPMTPANNVSDVNAPWKPPSGGPSITPFNPTGSGVYNPNDPNWIKSYDQQYAKWQSTPQAGYNADSWQKLMQSLLPTPGIQTQGQAGNFDPSKLTGGTQNTLTTGGTGMLDPNQNNQLNQYNSLTAYNSPFGGGGTTQNNTLQPNPSGGTVQPQGFYY